MQPAPIGQDRLGAAKSHILPRPKLTRSARLRKRTTIQRPYATPERETRKATLPSTAGSLVRPSLAPLDRNHPRSRPLRSRTLRRGAQPLPQQRLRRQQRAWWQGGAIDLQRPSTHQPFPNAPATFQKSIKNTRRRTCNKQLTGKYAPGTSDKDGASI